MEQKKPACITGILQALTEDDTQVSKDHSMDHPDRRFRNPRGGAGQDRQGSPCTWHGVPGISGFYWQFLYGFGNTAGARHRSGSCVTNSGISGECTGKVAFPVFPARYAFMEIFR